MNNLIRLNVFLASAGVGSRRNVNEIIKQERVKVNGKLAQLNHRIDPQKDEILVDGQKISKKFEPIYIVLNKPKGIIATAKDEFGRKSVINLIESEHRVYPVGRLDATTSGLILLTNDGELAFKLTHPKFHIPKTYHLTIQGQVSEESLEKLQQGVKLKEGMARADEVNILQFEHNRTLLELKLHQGWNHQVKRMCSALNLNLISLRRVAIGPLELGSLAEGEYRHLTAQELKLIPQLILS